MREEIEAERGTEKVKGNLDLICGVRVIDRPQVLKKCSDCQLLVCDEGHRLKNIGGNATIKALNMLPAKKRILLSGTPVQNNLDEFYAVSLFHALIDSPPTSA